MHLVGSQGAVLQALEERRQLNQPQSPVAARQKHSLGATLRPRLNAQSLGLSTAEYEQAKRCFIQYDTDRSNTLSLQELEQLVAELLRMKNLRADDEVVKRLANRHFREADVDGNNMLDFDEFVSIYQKILRVYDVAM